MTLRQGWLVAWVLVAAAAARAQTVPVPNPSFEEGRDQPAGWSLSGGEGRWLDSAAADGRRAVAVTGKGDDSNFWRSGPLALDAGGVYLLRFKVRRDGTGGTPVSGPPFANRDLGDVPDEWKTCESVFAVPADLKPDAAYVRFGQWNVKGTVAFDAVELSRAMPVFAWKGRLALGEGERIEGNTYTFDAPFRAASRNHSRPLAGFTCAYNSDRWTFAAGQEVVYRQQVAGRKQTAAEVAVAVTWYSAGELAVEASADGNSWQALGTIGKVSAGTFKVPAALLPAETVFVRMTARPGGEKKTAGAALQVGDYAYRATLDGGPNWHAGATRFFAVESVDPRFDVRIVDVGDMIPGEFNLMTYYVKNLTGKPLAAVPMVVIEQPGRAAIKARDSSFQLPAGEDLLQLRYFFGEAGSGRMRVFFGDSPLLPRIEAKQTQKSLNVVIDKGQERGFSATANFSIPELYNPDYGERLPASSDEAGLWWAPSGWKIPPKRGVPTENGPALLIRAARNEAEAAQLVVRAYEKPLRGLTVKAGTLAGPGGAAIAAGNVEILKVRYVSVTHPTDSSGCVGLWPDPLPPIAGPINVDADRNQPLWVRVRVPKDAKAGTYEGRIRLAAEGYAADVPLRVEVYDFALPDRMTCQTAFGFSPGNVWRYQKLEKPEDRRAVLEKYLAGLSAHHISPYDPAPLDNFKVTWPKKKGGTPDEEKGLVPALDWAAWDAAMTRAIDQYHFSTFMLHVPGMGGGSFHARFEPEFLGYKEAAPEYKIALTNYLRAVQEHLREKGWLRYAYVYWFDEPDKKDYAFVMNGFKKLKEAAPDLRRMLTEQVEAELVGGPNLWCPVTPNYNPARADERRKAGDHFWWYVCCGPKAPYATLFIDHPATELRVWLWQTWQRGIEGILIWQTNYWTSDAAYPDRARPQNPYEDPMGWVSGYGAAKGARQPWGNGDGRFIYPPEAAADASPPQPVLEGPVDSIRLEMLRDGIEDYEYLVILRRLLAERGATLAAGERQRLEALLEVPEDITKDMTTFTKDPAPIERRRDAVARAIEALSKP
ncbi:MAG: DUF4091 domain-containing protein [Planctomycetes bacterium]|nr:DUF4091 domain-containing protein [Planctomycetota bacterium]